MQIKFSVDTTFFKTLLCCELKPTGQTDSSYLLYVISNTTIRQFYGHLNMFPLKLRHVPLRLKEHEITCADYGRLF